MQKVQENPGACDCALELDKLKFGIDFFSQRFDSSAKIASSGTIRRHGCMRPITRQREELGFIALEALTSAAPFGENCPDFRCVHADFRIALRLLRAHDGKLLGDDGILPVRAKKRQANPELERHHVGELRTACLITELRAPIRALLGARELDVCLRCVELRDQWSKWRVIWYPRQ